MLISTTWHATPSECELWKFRVWCFANSSRTELGYPSRKYIAQVARFDPAKGIPTVIDSYAEFRRRADKAGVTDVPQLVV